MRRLSVCLSVLVLLVMPHAASAGIFVFQDGSNLGEITPYAGALSGADNYNYFSASGHPINGPTLGLGVGHVFLYEGSDGLSLNMIFGVDNSGTRFPSEFVSWDIQVSGSTVDPGVILSDDGNELRETTTNDTFAGRWQYGTNTEGGVIGALGGNWIVDVNPLRYEIGTNPQASLLLASGLNGFISLDPSKPFRFAQIPRSSQVPEPASAAVWSFFVLGSYVVIRRRR